MPPSIASLFALKSAELLQPSPKTSDPARSTEDFSKRLDDAQGQKVKRSTLAVDGTERAVSSAKPKSAKAARKKAAGKAGESREAQAAGKSTVGKRSSEVAADKATPSSDESHGRCAHGDAQVNDADQDKPVQPNLAATGITSQQDTPVKQDVAHGDNDSAPSARAVVWHAPDARPVEQPADDDAQQSGDVKPARGEQQLPPATSEAEGMEKATKTAAAHRPDARPVVDPLDDSMPAKANPSSQTSKSPVVREIAAEAAAQAAGEPPSAPADKNSDMNKGAELLDSHGNARPLQLPDAAPASPSPANTHATAAAAPPPPQLPPEVHFAEANHASIVSGVRANLLPHGGSMQIRLDPPELGALQVNVEMRDGVMSAMFQTSSDDATRLLSHSLGQLKTALESQGVTVEKIQVQQAPRDQHARNSEDQSQQQQRENHSAQQEQQRREMLRRMWRRISGGRDPVDLVA